MSYETASYTPKLATYSKYYKTFSNILQIRTILAEYLVAMKLMAGHKLSKLFQLTVLQMKEKLEMGYSVEIEHVVINKINILLEEYNLENIIAFDCDMKAKYPMYRECKYPYSAMKVYK